MLNKNTKCTNVNQYKIQNHNIQCTKLAQIYFDAIQKI